MTLKQLEYIVAVDTYRHFATAAQHCHVSQPSVSMLILKLEEQLGTPIFDRSRHPVVPTEFGTAIIARARRVLQEAAQLRGLVEGQKKVLQEELRVGVIPTLAPYLLPQLVQSLRQKYPQVQRQAL